MAKRNDTRPQRPWGSCTGLMRQGFGRGDVAGMASVSRSQHYPMSDQSSSCSKRDPLLPELSHEWCCGCSGRVDLREGKPAVQQQLGDGSRKCDRNGLQPSRSRQPLQLLHTVVHSTLSPQVMKKSPSLEEVELHLSFPYFSLSRISKNSILQDLLSMK